MAPPLVFLSFAPADAGLAGELRAQLAGLLRAKTLAAVAGADIARGTGCGVE
jgi:hypothetical protein